MKHTIAALLLSASVAQAAENKPTPMVLGYGGRTCNQWITAKGSNQGLYYGVEGWITGYLSGVNWVFAGTTGVMATGTDGRGPRFDITERYSLSDVIAWTTVWCRDHPLDKIDTAVRATIDELVKRF